MNKLISRNPVLRFKEGLKILKFQNAGVISYKGRDGIDYEAWRGEGNWYYRKKGTLDILNMPKNYVTTSGIRFYDANGNMIKNPSSNLNNGSSPRDYSFMTKGRLSSESAENKKLRESYFNSQKEKLGFASPSTTKSTDKTSFKSAFNKARQSGLLEFVWNGGRYTTQNEGEENFIFQNGKWVAPQPAVETPVVPQIQLPTAPPSIYNLINPVEKDLKAPLSAPVVPQTYNRAQVRDFIRNKGVNPYSFTGDQRRAVRMVLNGQGTDEDKALVQSMGIFNNKPKVVPLTISEEDLNTQKKVMDLTKNMVTDRKWWDASLSPTVDILNLLGQLKLASLSYKQGGMLPSRNIVERFKLRNFRLVPVTTLKTGGNIPKLQTAWLPINWNDNNKFVDLVVSNVANEVKKAKRVVENQRKANNVANRKTKVPGIDNTAKLQLVLYDKGFFKGVIDKRRTGKQVTLERAVDGYMGDMTNQAIQNAKKAGYTVDINTGEIKLPKKKELAYGKTQKKLPQQLQQASTFSFTNVKNVGKELLGRIFGDKDIITGRNELAERSYQFRYNTPYSLEIDRGEPAMKRLIGPDGFISYQLVEGSDGRPVYTSKAGNLGLFNRKTDEEGRVCYQIKNDKGELVTRCSETGNLINRSLGLPTTGDAWTRHGVYGDSLIYGGADHNKIYSRPVGKIINGLRPDLLNPNNLKTGDFVDLYTEGSGHNAEAAKGRGNSHTGTIYKPMGDNGPVYIIHGGFNDKVYIDPLDRFGPLSTWSIMGVRRPGSKEHPYYKEDI